MAIDPGNKCFVGIFSVLILGVIGFFISSIFIDASKDLEVQKIEFGQSKFWISVKRLKADKRYVLEVYNGNKMLKINRQKTLIALDCATFDSR